MKLIVAYIQPERLDDVKRELVKAELFGMSVTNTLGCGRQKGYTESYRGVEFEVNLLKKVRVEVAVNDEHAKPAIEAIVRGARTGQIGDGKIFVLDLIECTRIRTGESG